MRRKVLSKSWLSPTRDQATAGEETETVATEISAAVIENTAEVEEAVAVATEIEMVVIAEDLVQIEKSPTIPVNLIHFRGIYSKCSSR